VLADRLAEMGHSVDALHGGMPQGRRNRVLANLRSKRLRVLVATDVAARGIDVPSISHVINFGLPMKEEDYVHRIGRTGRAGRTGLAVTLAERRDFGMIQRIQRFTTQRIPGGHDHGSGTPARRAQGHRAPGRCACRQELRPAAVLQQALQAGGQGLRQEDGPASGALIAANPMKNGASAPFFLGMGRVQTPSRSTSNTSVAFGGITPPAPRAP
jgi:superfamily II DNA/RNA helicase